MTTLYGFIKQADVKGDIFNAAISKSIIPAAIGLVGGGALGYLTGSPANPYTGAEDTRMKNTLLGGLLGGLGLGGASAYVNYNGITNDVVNALKSPQHASPTATNIISNVIDRENNS